VGGLYARSCLNYGSNGAATATSSASSPFRKVHGLANGREPAPGTAGIQPVNEYALTRYASVRSASVRSPAL